MESKSFSEMVNILRFPLAVLVVFIHCFGPNEIDLSHIHSYPLDGDSIYNLIRTCFSKVLPSFAVPTFFIISGYFFFYKYDKFNLSTYLIQIKKRVKTLLVPYIVWNIIPVLLRFIGVLILGKSILELFNFYTSEGWLSLFWNHIKELNAPINFPLWYLRDLIVVVIITPVIFLLIKKKMIGIVFLSLLSICYIFNFWVRIVGFSNVAILFFSVGAYMGFHKIKILDLFLRSRIIFYTIALVCLIVAVWFDASSTHIGGYFQKLYVLFVIPAVFCMCNNIKTNNKTNKFLNESSFFIYVSHTVLILNFIILFVNKIMPNDFCLLNIIKYFLIPIIVTIICLLLFYVFKKFFPKQLAFLIGGR